MRLYPQSDKSIEKEAHVATSTVARVSAEPEPAELFRQLNAAEKESETVGRCK